MRQLGAGRLVGRQVCDIPVERFPFSGFICLEEILNKSEVQWSEEQDVCAQ